MNKTMTVGELIKKFVDGKIKKEAKILLLEKKICPLCNKEHNDELDGPFGNRCDDCMRTKVIDNHPWK